MSPTMLRKEMQTDLYENIVPYLNKNYDNKIRRAIIKSLHLPMIFNPIHYLSKKTNNDWYIFYYAITKKLAEDAACIAISLVQSEEGTYVYEYVLSGNPNDPIYIFPPHFFSRYHSRYMDNKPIGKLELITHYIKNSYIGFVTCGAALNNRCALSTSNGYGVGDVISRKERIFMFKTFISKDMLRKNQNFARMYDIMKEENLLNYVISMKDPEAYLHEFCNLYRDSKL